MSVSACSAPDVPGKPLVYRKTGKTGLVMEVFFPSGWRMTDKRPAILFFHGGGFETGTRGQLAYQARYFASRGLVTATADYRTQEAYGTLPHKSIADGREAIRFLKRHAATLGVDARRIIVGGGSAGGTIATNAAFSPDYDEPGDDIKVSCRPAALLLFNPVLVLQPKHLAALKEVPALKDPVRLAQMQDILEPIPYVRKGAPPTILFYGTDDPALKGGQQFLNKSVALGNKADCWTAAGQSHGFFNDAPWRDATLILADRFLVTHGFLQGKSTIKPVKVTMVKVKQGKT
ncbi:MAG: alpha/beta hydrolase [Fibrella sp.]|nr:alpha/beta hydrolase [Armatimonadota bacterium]